MWLTENPDTEASKVVEKYNVFLEEIEQLDLCDVTELRPIINVRRSIHSSININLSLVQGRELLQVLGVSKGGSWTSELMTTITKWQLENPRGTKDDCIAWIQSEKSAGRLHLQATTSEPACKRVRTQ
jgi:tRNA nucleotidyltransferase (CCA-adding enzyme)